MIQRTLVITEQIDLNELKLVLHFHPHSEVIKVQEIVDGNIFSENE